MNRILEIKTEDGIVYRPLYVEDVQVIPFDVGAMCVVLGPHINTFGLITSADETGFSLELPIGGQTVRAEQKTGFIEQESDGVLRVTHVFRPKNVHQDKQTGCLWNISREIGYGVGTISEKDSGALALCHDGYIGRLLRDISKPGVMKVSKGGEHNIAVRLPFGTGIYTTNGVRAILDSSPIHGMDEDDTPF